MDEFTHRIGVGGFVGVYPEAVCSAGNLGVAQAPAMVGVLTESGRESERQRAEYVADVCVMPHKRFIAKGIVSTELR